MSEVDPELENQENEPNIDDDPAVTTVEAPVVRNGKRRRNLSIGIAVLVLAVVSGLVYWLYSRQFESTDDAFIDGDIVQISPKVSAYITKVYVSANQLVHKGDLLVELDPTDLSGQA